MEETDSWKSSGEGGFSPFCYSRSAMGLGLDPRHPRVPGLIRANRVETTRKAPGALGPGQAQALNCRMTLDQIFLLSGPQSVFIETGEHFCF